MAIHSHNHLLKQFFEKQRVEVSNFKSEIVHEVEEALSNFVAHREKVIDQTSSNTASSLTSYASGMQKYKESVPIFMTL